MYRKTNRRNNKIKKRTIKKKKSGGKKYNHRRVGLFCKPTTTEYQIRCNVCGMNDYIERLSTLGKSKKNQVIMAFFTGDTFDDINNISITSYFCRICGMAKIIRGDKDYIYTKEYRIDIQ
jgi:hypothetical protein